MKCAFCNVGTRGDLQPLVALALRFRSKGWDVLLISEERVRPLAEEFGIEFRVVTGDSTGIIFEEEYAEMLAKGKLMAMMQEICSPPCRVGSVASRQSMSLLGERSERNRRSNTTSTTY